MRTQATRGKDWRRGSESNRRIKVLQTSPLPLGYRALTLNYQRSLEIVHPKAGQLRSGYLMRARQGAISGISNIARAVLPWGPRKREPAVCHPARRTHIINVALRESGTTGT